MVLTEEQKRRMEENKRRALEKRNIASHDSNIKVHSTTSTEVRTKPFVQSVNQSKPLQASAKSFYKPSTSVPPIHPKSTPFQTQKPSGSSAPIRGKCVLLSRDRFTVDVRYHEQLITTFRTIPSSQYNASDRSWSFALSDHDLLMKSIAGLRSQVTITGLSKDLLNVFLNRSDRSAPSDLDDRIEPFLLDHLMPFQLTGIQYSLAREGRVLIADDMGLGKTIQALGVVSYYREEWPLLIVCPSSVRFAWKSAIVKWLPSVKEDDITVITTGKEYLCNGSVLIISYDLMARRSKELEERLFRVAIMDECHFLKNHKSSRCQAAERILKGTKRIVFLSGTPALSRPIELFSQISIIDNKLFKNPIDFGMRYCDGKKVSLGARGTHHDFSGASNMNELKLLLEERCMIRRLKRDVLSQLPAKQREMILLDPAAIKSKTKEMQEKAKLMNSKSLSGSERRGVLLEWYRHTATAKSKAVLDYLKDLLEGDKKFLCFAHHQIMMDEIASLLDKQKVRYIRIDGSTSSDARKVLVDNFQATDAIRVALLSITAANAGITLTAAQLVVFAELFWNPGILTQAEDRAHRIGQTDSVTVQYLVARGTADDEMWPLIQKKLDVLNKAGLSKDDFRESDTHDKAKNETEPKITDFFSTSMTQELEAIDWDEEDFDMDVSPAKRPRL